MEGEGREAKCRAGCGGEVRGRKGRSGDRARGRRGVTRSWEGEGMGRRRGGGGRGSKRIWRGRSGKREDLITACFLGPAQPLRKC